ncbi:MULTISPECIES: hypothetical protein [unclassified Ruegeria]|uniref:hypothetical protein n=1 Tax=unclassified Ruegeria TaxID=2625375 RepID=UPI00148909E2|nr:MULTISPECIES: hypothetical protein [unclassified Ruegeria]
MTKFRFRAFLTTIVTSASLILTSGAVATFALAPDAAFAKSDKAKGAGKGRGKGSGKGKAGKGNKNSKTSEYGKSRDKARKNNSFQNLFKKNNGSNKAKSKPKNGTTQRVSFSEFGREFKRDVEELFGTRSSSRSNRGSKPVKKSYRQASIDPVDRSPRPVARSTGAYTWHQDDGDLKPPKRRKRDPLVASITDPYGSDKLRNLNASNAAAPAFRNASPNSNVGKIATYQAEATEYYDLRADLYEARRDLRDLNEGYDGRSSYEIADDIAGLDPSDPDYDEQLDELEAELREAELYEETRDDLRQDVKDLSHETKDALADAESAFFEASKGRTLTRSALGEFYENLDLPQPKDRLQDDVTIQPVPYDPDYHRYSDNHAYFAKDAAYILRYDDVEYPHKKGWNGYKRDPLVAAITDPYGSDKLRNLNASNAAAPAFQNAAPNSNVGKIASYQFEASEYYELRAELYETRRNLRALNENYGGRSSDEIADDIADLDLGDPNYDDKLDTLERELLEAEAYEEIRDNLRADLKDLRVDTLVAQKEAEYAFFQASKGEVLTTDTISDLHDNLDLPTPVE